MGKKIAASTTATQEEIDDAWKFLFDAVQALQFKNGNMAGLEAVLDIANSLNQKDFTQDSWNAMVVVRDEAQAMLDGQDSLQQEIDEMTQALANALNDLVPATALDQLRLWRRKRILTRQKTTFRIRTGKSLKRFWDGQMRCLPLPILPRRMLRR